MPLDDRRERVLFGLGTKRGRPHRYTYWRWAVGTVFTVAVALLPLLDVLRFDFWGGRHIVLGREVGLVEAAKAFAFPFLGVNIAIVLLSRFVGRYLCGFVCPVGSLARLGEWMRWSDKRRGVRLWRSSVVAAVSIVLAGITFSFWVDWRVFDAGSPRAMGLAGAFLLAVALSLYIGARTIGLRFCRDWCPSGVYFAVLGPKTLNGVEFANPSACTDCHACESVCPVDLMPREMAGGARPGTGLYPDDLTDFSHCLRCGDCVLACEATTARSAVTTPLRLGWLPTDSQAADPPEATPTDA